MLTIIDDAVFLRCEKKSFGKAGEVVEFGQIKVLDGNDEVITATMNTDMYDNLVHEGMPERLDTIRIELDVTEEKGKNGSYLKKKFVKMN